MLNKIIVMVITLTANLALISVHLWAGYFPDKHGSLRNEDKLERNARRRTAGSLYSFYGLQHFTWPWPDWNTFLQNKVPDTISGKYVIASVFPFRRFRTLLCFEKILDIKKLIKLKFWKNLNYSFWWNKIPRRVLEADCYCQWWSL